jgi:hypothetical protein
LIRYMEVRHLVYYQFTTCSKLIGDSIPDTEPPGTLSLCESGTFVAKTKKRQKYHILYVCCVATNAENGLADRKALHTGLTRPTSQDADPRGLVG